MSLLAQPACRVPPGAEHGGVVDRGDRDGKARVGLGLVLVAEHAEREKHEVDVTAVEGAVDDGTMALGVGGLERHLGHSRVALRGEAGDRGVKPCGRTAGQDDPPKPGSGKAADRCQGDLAGTTQHQHRLQITDGIQHSLSLRARSDMKTPLGSMPFRVRRHSARRGYEATTVSGDMRESFAR